MGLNCILHVGMHKTGSSSIQESLGSLDMKGVEYLSLGNPNHSGFFSTLLADQPELYHGNIYAGRDRTQSLDLQEKYRHLLHQRLNEVTKNTVLISAEDLSSFNKAKELKELQLLLAEYCNDIKVIGYVRSPVSFMQSAFQQILQGSDLSSLNAFSLYPRYRERFEQLDNAFGRSNVTLIPFSENQLFKSDVVLDFCQRVGIDIPPEKIKRVNESLSLEAVAVLFAYRKLGGKHGTYASSAQENKMLINAISSLGTRKFTFHKDLVEPVLDHFSEDLEWIEKRVGQSMFDPSDGPGGLVRSEDSLLEVAKQSGPRLIDLFMKLDKGEDDITRVAKLVSILKKINKDEGMNRNREPSIFSDGQLQAFRSDKMVPAGILREVAKAFEANSDVDTARAVIEQAVCLDSDVPGVDQVWQRLAKKMDG